MFLPGEIREPGEVEWRAGIARVEKEREEMLAADDFYEMFVDEDVTLFSTEPGRRWMTSMTEAARIAGLVILPETSTYRMDHYRAVTGIEAHLRGLGIKTCYLPYASYEDMDTAWTAAWDSFMSDEDGSTITDLVVDGR